MVKDSGQAGVQITSEMLEAGRNQFREWFNLPDNAEALLELPEDVLVNRLVYHVFLAMKDAGATSAK